MPRTAVRLNYSAWCHSCFTWLSNISRQYYLSGHIDKCAYHSNASFLFVKSSGKIFSKKSSLTELPLSPRTAPDPPAHRITTCPRNPKPPWGPDVDEQDLTNLTHYPGLSTPPTIFLSCPKRLLNPTHKNFLLWQSAASFLLFFPLRFPPPHKTRTLSPSMLPIIPRFLRFPYRQFSPASVMTSFIT